VKPRFSSAHGNLSTACVRGPPLHRTHGTTIAKAVRQQHQAMVDYRFEGENTIRVGVARTVLIEVSARILD
jgi:hypothetical protein